MEKQVTEGEQESKTITERFDDGDSLYAILGVAKDASAAEIKKAYYKSALRCHPDRVQADASDDDKARAKSDFQTLGRIYETLSDDEKRKFYDETGSMEHDDFLSSSKDKNWEDYWRLLFKKITAEDIKSYAKSYKGTDLESADIKKAYTDHEGDMESIIEHVVLSSWDDEERFRAIIDAAIETGELPRFPAYAAGKQSNRAKKQKAKEKREAKKAEKAAKRLGLGGDSSEDKLKQLIVQNKSRSESRFGSLISNLEAKYGGGKPARKGKRKSEEANEDEPSEEAFLAARERLNQRAKNGGGKASESKQTKGRKKQKVEKQDDSEDDNGEEEEEEAIDEEDYKEPTEEEFEQARQRLEQKRKAASTQSEKKTRNAGGATKSGRGGRGRARGKGGRK